MARPPDVHIDDLVNPRFASDIEEMMSAVVPFADSLVLAPDALMDQARAETDLDDFGDPWFREPLAVLLDAADTEAHLSPMGRVSTHAQVLQLLKNRLLVQHRLTLHPEILNVEIRRPIIIAGLPRTGTTHLHNLVSSDPALRSLPYWESVEPVLNDTEQAEVDRGEPDPRLARTEAALTMLNNAVPFFKRMHDMTTWHVHEEIQLLAMDFATMLFESSLLIPTYGEWYRSTDQTPAYEHLKTVLKVLQWSRGGDRWVLKSPQHLEQFGPLIRTFPDCTVVVTHRDPVAVTASLTTMLAYLARLSSRPVDAHGIGRYWGPRIERMLNACARDRDLLPDEQSIDVHFREFMADDVAMVERIYALAGQPFTPTARRAMTEFMAAHPRGRHGRVHYDLADVGLDEAERQAALKNYVDRFGVAAETLNEG
jgi:sulfotransferase family protein